MFLTPECSLIKFARLRTGSTGMRASAAYPSDFANAVAKKHTAFMATAPESVTNVAFWSIAILLICPIVTFDIYKGDPYRFSIIYTLYMYTIYMYANNTYVFKYWNLLYI